MREGGRCSSPSIFYLSFFLFFFPFFSSSFFPFFGPSQSEGANPPSPNKNVFVLALVYVTMLTALDLSFLAFDFGRFR